MKKTKSRILASFVAVMLCFTAFSTVAFANGNDPEAKPETTASTEQAEETEAPTTGGIEDTADADENASDTAETETMTEEDVAELLSSLFGSQVEVTTTDSGLQITSNGEAASIRTGTVTTNGGNLNVRTGAGTDNAAITQLPNGTEVEVIGTEGGWVKILLPEREGYVCGDYLTISDTSTGDGSFSLSLGEDELSSLMGLLGGGGGSALTPDGNLTLIDDYGSTTGTGKQFITLETKAGNVFYLIIDRDDKGEETVHFLNQVDEADLMALMEDGQTTQEQPATCTCTEKCVAGAVNTACPVCATNMSACTGKEPEPETPEETPEPEEPAQKTTGLNPALLLAVLALMGGGGAFAYFKFIKNKPKTKGNDNLDDYDYGEDDTDQEDEDPWETEESDELDADGGGDEESEDKAD